MAPPFLFFLLPLLSAAVLDGLAVYNWRAPSTPGSRAFSVVLLLSSVWALTFALEMLVIAWGGNLVGAVALVGVRFTALSFSGLAWLAMVLLQTGQTHYFKWYSWAALSLIPLCTALLAWTGGALPWFRYNYHLEQAGSYVVLAWNNGPWYYVYMGYSYALYAAVILLSLRLLRAMPRPRRRLIILVIAGILITLLIDLLRQVGLTPVAGLNLAASFALLPALLIVWTLFRYRSPNLIPFARSTLLENMKDLVLVINEEGRLADANRAAEQVLGFRLAQVYGRPAVQVLQQWPDLASSCTSPDPANRETKLGEGEKERIYDLSVTLLQGTNGQLAGHLLVLRDISERKRAESDMKRLNEELEQRVQQRTEALSRRAAELEAITDVSAAMRNAQSLDEIISRLLEATARSLHADVGILLLRQAGALVVEGIFNLSEELRGHRHLPCSDPLWQAVQSSRASFGLISSDSAAASVFYQSVLIGMEQVAIIPFQAGSHVLGLMALARRETDHLLEEYRQPLVAIAEIGGNAIQRVQVQEQQEHLVQSRTRDLMTLYEVTAITNQFRDLKGTMEQVLDKILAVMSHSWIGMIHVVDEDEKTLRLVTGRDKGGGAALEQPVLPDEVPWGQVWEEAQTVIVPDWRKAFSSPTAVPMIEAPAYIGVPIQSKGKRLGVLSVFAETLQHFSVEDIALLAAIGDQLGSAIESARLHRRAEQAAVIEERQRLARELHDSVTQSFYSLTLFAAAGQDAAAQGDLAQVRHFLDRLGETAQQALREMRLLIYELRPLALAEVGLIAALRQRLETVERRLGLETWLDVQGPIETSEQVETALYRIAQEALNNVLRHSQATEVAVRIESNPDKLVMRVADNGQGFDLEAGRERGGMGLASMRERAEKIGGTLDIVSHPGDGTVVQATIGKKEIEP